MVLVVDLLLWMSVTVVIAPPGGRNLRRELVRILEEKGSIAVKRKERAAKRKEEAVMRKMEEKTVEKKKLRLVSRRSWGLIKLSQLINLKL